MKTHNNHGFALAGAIGALVIVGFLVTAGFYVARQELRIGVASKNSAMALSTAQNAANDVMSNFASYNLATIADWTPETINGTDDYGNWEVIVTKVGSRLYFLDATSNVTVGGGMWSGASRRIGLLTRMNTADIEPPAALTTQGGLKYGGSAIIKGLDDIPNGSSDGAQADWSSYCDVGDLTDKPGLLINDTTVIDWNGNRNKIESNMNGTPSFDEDPTITTENLLSFGDLTWDDMVGLADVVWNSDLGNPGPSTSGGACNTPDLLNWGEPRDPNHVCFSYFPIIYLSQTGETNMSGGIGQGILLVEGDLKVTGGFEFYGPVFIKGTLTTMGSGGHFWGGVVAGNVDLAQNTVLGNAVITNSSCAVERALLNNSSLTKVRPLASRSWVDLSNVGN